MVEIEGIHSAPFITRNCTRYMPECLKKSVPKWTNPYLRPLIKHHNDKDGEIIGRIYSAEYSERSSVENSGTLIFTVAVPDEKAEKEIQNRLLETVSIGVSGIDVRCSICGNQIDEDGSCPEGHERTQYYDDKLCCWDIYECEPKELSYVIVPSDQYAKNSKIYKIGQKNNDFKESLTEKIKNPKNGGKIVPTTEELQKKIEDLEKDLEQERATTQLWQSEVEKLKEEKQALENEVSKAKEDLQKAEEDKNTFKTTADEAENKINDANLAKETAERETAEVKTQLATAIEEKEAAEEHGVNLQKEYRSFIESTLNKYRKTTGREELKEEEMSNRSLDSLKDSILDLEEELTKKGLEYEKVPNPAQHKKLNEEIKDYKQVDLKKEIETIFSRVI